MSVEKTARRTWGRASEGALAGAVAGALAVGIEILARTITGLPSPVELLGDQGTRFIPGPLFEFLLGVFGHAAKYLYFTGISLAQIAGLALLTALGFAMRGLVIRRRALTDAAPAIQAPVGWWFSAPLAACAWLLSGALALPFMGAGLFGANLPVGTLVVMVALLVPAAAFGVGLPLSQRGLRWLAPKLIGSPKLQRAFSPSRRLFLKRVSIGLVILGVGSLAWKFITEGIGNGSAAGANSLDGPPPPERITPAPTPAYGAWQTVNGETPELTSVNDFYYVSKNVYTDPSLDAGSWRLTVNGEGVEHPFTLSYQDVMNLPAVEQITTLECISNVVGGNLLSSARWKGVPLQDLLERAGVKAGATKVVFHAADSYTDSIHLSKALDPMTLLVYLMNDQPLTQAHGFPARMIVPGIYGMKHCKWITQIEVVNYNFLGYWQQEGWNDDAVINLGARIDVPFNNASLPVNQQTTIAGVAFAGAKGVSAVDVSTDNGRTWRRAALKKPLGAVTWTLWELPWQPTSKETYAIVARMIDLQGYYQQPVLAAPYPNGATGYHRIYVDAS
ncbi:MAG TPA: molybdopterin-dependent oxidoreductase [Ktedonobacterales bacterium]|jgi:DMSO/TMAO reductase YedYZ molybdopterin-dependent catalytic subunit